MNGPGDQFLAGAGLARDNDCRIRACDLLDAEQHPLDGIARPDDFVEVVNFNEIIGASDTIKRVLFSVQKVACTDTTVIVTGETGTGKELVARAIHSASARSQRALVKVNCAALPATLIEAELFGHEKGAFTGAEARKQGRFELADGATIFLDEIGELPLQLQVKLLR